MQQCFNCGFKKENLAQFGKCKLAKYCSKECQINSWKTVYKKLCSQSYVLLRLSCSDRYEYEDLKWFYFNSIERLPQFKQPNRAVLQNNEVNNIYIIKIFSSLNQK